MLQEELLKSYEEMNDAMEKAPESTTPFPVMKNDKMYVVGDANETKINNHDFSITFRLPKGTVDGEEVNGGVLKTVEYKDVFVTPRQSGKVISAYCRMLPFFRKYREGDLESYSHEDVVEMLSEYGNEFVDALYDLVASVLQIDEALVDYMLPSSAISATAQILHEYPEIINEGESFF